MAFESVHVDLAIAFTSFSCQFATGQFGSYVSFGQQFYRGSTPEAIFVVYDE